MTTRRGRSSGSGQPGSRAWRETIEGIKRELDADNGRLLKTLAEQDTERAEEIQLLTELAQSLRIEELLSYMNDTLLDGQGVVERTIRWLQMTNGDDGEDWDEDDDDDEDDGDWEDDEDDDDWDEEDDEDDFFLSATLSITLTWKDAGRLQVSVDLEEMEEEETIELNVNGMQVERPTARNLQNALVQAFREQMDEDYGNFEED